MFNERLKKLREQAGMTQEGLARLADISTATVAKLEHVKGQDPNWSTVLKLAKALGVSVAAFVPDEAPPPAQEGGATKGKRKKGGAK